MMRKLAVRGLIALSLGGTALLHADWPQYLGPNRNAVASAAKLARSWDNGMPTKLWEVQLGGGFAAPAVADGKVYILDRTGPKNQEKDVFRCLDFATGKELWTFEYDAPGTFSFPGSRATPTVDGNRVYTVGPHGHTYCFDTTTQKPLWSLNVLEKFSGKRPHWAVSQSPVIYKNTVIVAPFGSNGGLVALNKATGESVWSSERMAGGDSYVSPVLTTIGGVDQLITSTAKKNGGVYAFAAADGKALWQYKGWSCNIPITPPTPIGDGRIFITGEYGAGSAMIKVENNGGTFAVTELYTTDQCGAQIHPPVLVDGYLYANSNGNKRRDGMVCMALDGTRKWRTADVQGAPLFERGGLLLADGLIFSLEGENGSLRLIEPSPDGYKELASSKPLSGKQVWAPLVLVDGKLLIRDQKRMVLLDVAAK